MLPVILLYFISIVLGFILGFAAYKDISPVWVVMNIVIFMLTLISFVKFEGVF